MRTPGTQAEPEPLDLSEKGRRDGQPISLDRRLFMKFTAFGRCRDPERAARALAQAKIEGVLYADANDPQGIGIMAPSEDPELFVAALRQVLTEEPFAALEHKPEFDMLGRSYSIGYEPDLEETLLLRPGASSSIPHSPGPSGTHCSAQRNFRHWRPTISAASSPSTERSRIATAPEATRPTFVSRATASTRMTTTSSSDCSDRSSIRFPRSCRKCAKPSRRRSISIASVRSSSARYLAERPLTRPTHPTEHAVGHDRGAHDYDAVLVVSFGGPEGPADVLPFLDNVFRGLRVGDETKQRIAARYEAFGGVSPINAHTRTFIAALKEALDRHGPALPIYWGNRNWHPHLRETVAQMAHDGIGRAIAYVTSTFSSYSSCRKYREDLYEAAATLPNAPIIDKLGSGFNHPGFIAAVCDRVGAALEQIALETPREARLSYSRPTACPSPWRGIAGTRPSSTRLVSSSATRSSTSAGASPTKATMRATARKRGSPQTSATPSSTCGRGRADDVVVVPIGFVCDHMEVVLDLDVDAARRAREIGINMVRAGTVGTHPGYVGMVRELIVERMTPKPTPPARFARHESRSSAPSTAACRADQAHRSPLFAASTPAPKRGLKNRAGAARRRRHRRGPRRVDAALRCTRSTVSTCSCSRHRRASAVAFTRCASSGASARPAARTSARGTTA